MNASDELDEKLKNVDFDADLKKLDKIIEKTENVDIEDIKDINGMAKDQEKGMSILNNLKEILKTTEEKFNNFEKNLDHGNVNDNKSSFGDNINKLENIIKNIEQNISGKKDSSLADCIKKCESGLSLIKNLESRLENAEKKNKNPDAADNVIKVDEDKEK